eukprot:NODE_38_length_30618_cov_0.377142.p15 type:complete len:179 gc:universal NODE_38_length_30618_cov_0.377142:26252-25716(-)
MGKVRKTRLIKVKKMAAVPKKPVEKKVEVLNHVPQVPSTMFLNYNSALVPPYSILVDTNFINMSIKNKLDIVENAMSCLFAKVEILVTQCVMAELEKLGEKYRLALRTAKNFEMVPCSHKGTYADDCLVQRVERHRCFIVATCDRDLKKRIRKVAGVPILFVSNHQFKIERLPDASLF